MPGGKEDTVRLRTDVALVPGGVKASACNENQWGNFPQIFH
ncbi:hypothetical protein X953_11670 [Virgibacillus sp. SK37]|nr:hypothetical protein X953_11670 [Virgibacillus sp. SK37]